MDETELEKVDSGRRDFLKKSLAAGAVVWGAPAVTSLPGGRAWAQEYPCVNPCTTRDAYGLQVRVGSLVLRFPAAPGPPTTCVINPTVPPILNLAATLCGDLSTLSCSARGYVEDLDLQILGTIVPILSLQATVLEAIVEQDRPCPDCVTTGTSRIAGVVINGGAINVTSPCNTFIPVVPALPIAELRLNEQTCDGDRLIVNALRLTIPTLGIEVIAGHAEAGAENCVCTPCA